MASPDGSHFRDRSFSPKGRNLLRPSSPSPSFASAASIGNTVVVETLRPKKNHAGGHNIGHKSRRVIGNDAFHLPADSASPSVVTASPSDMSDDGMKIACPICNQNMINLTQLNKHLDSAHSEVGQREKDNVQSKFMKYLSKAKSYPVQALNSTFAYADLSDLSFTVPLTPGMGAEGMAFNGNGIYSSSPNGSHVSNYYASAASSPPYGSHNGHHANYKHSSSHSAKKLNNASKPKLTEESVTRTHWQKETNADKCAEFKCRKLLNNKTGKVNCRSCGKLYCDEHVSCQMKLSRQAKWDPVAGVWCRVCFSCFESRPGYNDASGKIEDLTELFKSERRKTVDKAHLEINLLEKRLTRLLSLMIDSGDVIKTSSGWSNFIAEKSGNKTVVAAAGMAGTAAVVATGYYKQIRNYNKTLEQSVVAWDDEKVITSCEYCDRNFNFSLRKHHCRLCGKVVCSDPTTECSSNITFDSGKISEILNKPVDENLQAKVRICKECKAVVFGRREFAEDIAFKPGFVKIYEHMVEFKRGIESLLPRFQKLLDTFDDPGKPPSHDVLSEATKVRKKLLYSFQEYDTAAKRIWKMPTRSSQQAKLQNNIHVTATGVLQMYMLPLRSLPNVLKHAQAGGGGGGGALPRITTLSNIGVARSETSTPVSSTTSKNSSRT
ncbi:FYVE zinc finger-domain-containing protein [Lipomyces japonicus]|uniref:FYVE zinc finger-domain-containing protein n=1 Tax=Lipomyces japonicus TaxID=56871 RepID=UPI0034CD2936